MREELQSKEKFIDYYVKNFSTGIFSKQLNTYGLKLRKLKTKKGKDDYLFLFYSSYLQLLENFFIFLLVLFDKNSIDNIFENNRVQRERILDLLKLKQKDGKIIYGIEFDLFLRKIIKEYIGTNENEYTKYIKEAIKDYFSYKDLLNSYKHGFRLNSHGEGKTYILMNDKHFLVSENDSSILYYTKKGNKIYENKYFFNFEYIGLKAEFIINLIDNLKLNQLNIGKKFKRETIYVKDNLIKSKFPTSITKSEIFETKNTP